MFNLHLPTLTLAYISVFWLLTIGVLLIGWQFNQHKDIKLWGLACLLISTGTSVYNIGNVTETSGLVWIGTTAAICSHILVWLGTKSFVGTSLSWRTASLAALLGVGVYTLILANHIPLALRITWYCVFYVAMHLAVLKLIVESPERKRIGFKLYASVLLLLLILYGLRAYFAFDTPMKNTGLSQRYIAVYYLILMAEFVKFMTFIYLCFERLEHTLCQLALRDTLTQLPNRRAFVTQSAQRLLSNQPNALILADLDNFKSINDVYGHLAGDQVLVAFSQHLERITQQEGAFCARTGGEEFILLLSGQSVRRVQDIALQLKRQIEACQVTTEYGHHIQFTVSIGVGIKRQKQYVAMNQLFECADTALYEAKARGRNRIEFALTEHGDAPSSISPTSNQSPISQETDSPSLPKRYLERQSLS
ncbi:sensor domain-containing diguanylate cyclase [Salinivibrio kushneri]|uniref:GGDEF domain-containing protein n=1 Tax=Salinivibrio kushneri TaxID=1908198 RepID=UPI0009886FEA|nr:GGDEF domain-containing protein [Salinivibrio kushneri]OOE35756.1 hypothetical protein BZG04_08430 [Salinivibrio kushneri]OOE54603.1 hypothetical protein BZG12_06140 [Salinivibrio kushneri]